MGKIIKTAPNIHLKGEIGEPKAQNLKAVPAKWKRRNISVERDFPLILGANNPYLSMNRRREIATHGLCG